MFKNNNKLHRNSFAQTFLSLIHRYIFLDNQNPGAKESTWFSLINQISLFKWKFLKSDQKWQRNIKQYKEKIFVNLALQKDVQQMKIINLNWVKIYFYFSCAWTAMNNISTSGRLTHFLLLRRRLVLLLLFS